MKHLTHTRCLVFTATSNKFNLDDTNLDGLLENNRKWAAAVLKEDPEFFRNIAIRQEPKILWIGKEEFFGVMGRACWYLF